MTIVFHLYIAGASSYTRQILQLYEEACNQVFNKDKYRIEMIDILKKPDLAEKHKVLATPTLSRITPSPEKRIVGRVNSEQAVIAIQYLTEDLSTS